MTSNAKAEDSKVHHLCLLTVKKWDVGDDSWALDLGKNMISSSSDQEALERIDLRVKTYWAILRAKSCDEDEDDGGICAVDLYDITMEFDSWADDVTAELSRFRLKTWKVEEKEWNPRSRELCAIFSEMYTMFVAKTRANYNGMVYVGHGNGDGAMFECFLTPRDSRSFLSNATRALGRKLDFVDFAGNCNEASLSNLLSIGPFCEFLLASELEVVGYQDNEATADGSMTSGMQERYYASQSEYAYVVILSTKSCSVREMIIQRAQARLNEWRNCSKDILIKGQQSSISVFETKNIEKFRREVGAALAERGDGFTLKKAAVSAKQGSGSAVFYDTRNMLCTLAGTCVEDGSSNSLVDLFDSIRICYLTTAEAVTSVKWPALSGLYARPCALLRLATGFCSDEAGVLKARFAKGTDADDVDAFFMESDPWERGMNPGFSLDDAVVKLLSSLRPPPAHVDSSDTASKETTTTTSSIPASKHVNSTVSRRSTGAVVAATSTPAPPTAITSADMPAASVDKTIATSSRKLVIQGNAYHSYFNVRGNVETIIPVGSKVSINGKAFTVEASQYFDDDDKATYIQLDANHEAKKGCEIFVLSRG
eukprot:g1528.t1